MAFELYRLKFGALYDYVPSYCENAYGACSSSFKKRKVKQTKLNKEKMRKQ